MELDQAPNSSTYWVSGLWLRVLLRRLTEVHVTICKHKVTHGFDSFPSDREYGYWSSGIYLLWVRLIVVWIEINRAYWQVLTSFEKWFVFHAFVKMSNVRFNTRLPRYYFETYLAFYSILSITPLKYSTSINKTYNFAQLCIILKRVM